MIEKIVEHEYMDVYRIRDGVLLKVKKYKLPERSWGYWIYQKDKTVVKKLEGLKNLYRVIIDVDDDWHPVKVGDIILDGYKIIPVINPTEYRYEIKTTGESFSGDFDEFGSIMMGIANMCEGYICESESN